MISLQSEPDDVHCRIGSAQWPGIGAGIVNGLRKVPVSMTRDAIRQASEWQPELALLAQEEDNLHDHDAVVGGRRPARDQHVR